MLFLPCTFHLACLCACERLPVTMVSCCGISYKCGSGHVMRRRAYTRGVVGLHQPLCELRYNHTTNAKGLQWEKETNIPWLAPSHTCTRDNQWVFWNFQKIGWLCSAVVKLKIMCWCWNIFFCRMNYDFLMFIVHEIKLTCY